MLATAVLIIRKNWILSIGTSDVLRGWTLIWNNFNCIVLNASSHYTVTQEEGLILLKKENIYVKEKVSDVKDYSLSDVVDA